MGTKNSDIVSFFEVIATKHKKIAHVAGTHQHYWRMEFDEFASGVSKFTGYNFILEVVPYKFNSPSRDNSFKIREVAFIVVKSLPTVNKAAIATAFDECEVIVDDVLSKVNAMRNYFSSTLTYFDPETIEATPVSDGKNFGFRCSLEIKNSFNFEVIPDNWLL